MDLGSFRKKILLTGAGFSRNWGGYTAVDMWSRIKGDADVQKSEELQGFLIEESSFETALAKARAASVSSDAAQKLETATLRAFQSLDRQLIGAPRSGPTWINISGVHKLVFTLFAPPETTGSTDTGYFFTLNQDLWPERFLHSEWVHHTRPPVLPGLQLGAGQRFFVGNCSHKYEEVLVNVAAMAEEPSLKGQFNCIKLHGSFNWQGPAGEPGMVIGDHKALQISSSPLLTFYHRAFEQVLRAGDVRLMIIGYGFGDDHINSVLASAVQQCGLRVFIWNTRADFLEWLRSSAPHGNDILAGLITSEARQMIEVFPPDQRETESYRQIMSELFG